MSLMIEVRTEPVGDSQGSWGLSPHVHTKKDISHVRNCNVHRNVHRDNQSGSLVITIYLCS